MSLSTNQYAESDRNRWAARQRNADAKWERLKAEIYHRYYRRGQTQREIAGVLGLSQGAMSDRMKKWGWSTRRGGSRKGVKPKVTPEGRKRMQQKNKIRRDQSTWYWESHAEQMLEWLNGGAEQREIARRLGHAPSVISKALSRLGIVKVWVRRES